MSIAVVYRRARKRATAAAGLGCKPTLFSTWQAA
jgi:hypothetical protein